MDALVGGKIVTEGKGHDGKGVLIVGADADALGAFVGQGTDVNIGAECISAQDLDGNGGQLFGCLRNVNAQDAAVLFPAFVVFIRAQDKELLLGVVPVGADAFEHAGSIVQCMGENTDVSLTHGHVAAVEINDLILIRLDLHGLTPSRDSRYTSRPRASARSSISSHFECFMRRCSAASTLACGNTPVISSRAPSITILATRGSPS